MQRTSFSFHYFWALIGLTGMACLCQPSLNDDPSCSPECEPSASETCVCTDTISGAPCEAPEDDQCDCQEVEYDDIVCDPSFDEGCVCYDIDTGDACDEPERSYCFCKYADAIDPDDCSFWKNCDEDQPPPLQYGYILIEDRSPGTFGVGPGADIDAIGVVQDGVERFATTVEDLNISHTGDAFYDVTELLGPPDSECEAQNFVALGGAENNGYVIVGFSDAEVHYTFGPGTTIYVYELGVTSCPNQPNWLDDAYDVSVGNNYDLFTAAGKASQTDTNVFIAP